MPRTLKLAISQSHTLSTLALTLDALSRTARRAAKEKAQLLLFPEAYLGGYPRGCSFGSAIGSRSSLGRDQFLAYTQSAVDLGDTPRGAGDDWIERKLPWAHERGEEYRGDGTREFVEDVARETDIFLVIGVIERAGGCLYCSVLYVDPKRGCIGKRRKVMPTATERLVWAQGQPETLKAVTTVLRGVKVTLAAAVCWENYMPLLRAALYSQGVNLWCAPTADGREGWQALVKTIGLEGRCFVLSANQCLRRGDLPDWAQEEEQKKKPEVESLDDDIEASENAPQGLGSRRKSLVTKTADNHEITWPIAKPKIDNQQSSNQGNTSIKVTNGTERRPDLPDRSFPSSSSQSDDTRSPKISKVESIQGNHVFALPLRRSGTTSNSTERREDEIISHGGSCIISPGGEVLAGPLWDDVDGLLVTEVDLDDCDRGKLDLDVAGSYGRLDSFELKVQGLDLNPPP